MTNWPKSLPVSCSITARSATAACLLTPPARPCELTSGCHRRGFISRAVTLIKTYGDYRFEVPDEDLERDLRLALLPDGVADYRMSLETCAKPASRPANATRRLTGRLTRAQ